MKLEKEPIEIDFLIKSEPWSEKDLADFRELMRDIKRKDKSRKSTTVKKSVSKNQPHKVT